ncbi:hypothetical protein HSR122_0039 [Halapricum desulfuricans]|uniref:Uncharacterized protein n=1 Tax=Halapricum desulfuricans TaxID=2841257 RepID=A0A897N4Q6_9EURY|nr:hypothetical protein HSR122_0039 [Halapricum desulfuricans]
MNGHCSLQWHAFTKSKDDEHVWRSMSDAFPEIAGDRLEEGDWEQRARTD